MFRTRWRMSLVPVVIAAALGLGACGGAAGGTSGPAAATASSAPAGAASEPADQPSPTASAEASEPAGASPEAGGASPAAGGASGKVCDLVTADEMAGVLGANAVEQHYFAGPPDTCDYRVDGSPVAALVLLEPGNGAAMVFETMKADPDSKDVPGVGDKALFSSSMGTFLLLKGDRLLTLTASNAQDDTQRLDWLTQIARIAAGRM